MKELLDQYGKTVITAIILVVLTCIIAQISFSKATGLIEIGGFESGRLSDDNKAIEKSASMELLDSIVNTPAVELQVATHPKENEIMSVERLFLLDNKEVDIMPVMISTVKNGDLEDATSQGIAVISGRNITFFNAGTFYLTVDVRQDNRLTTQTFRIIVDRKS